MGDGSGTGKGEREIQGDLISLLMVHSLLFIDAVQQTREVPC